LKQGRGPAAQCSSIKRCNSRYTAEREGCWLRVTIRPRLVNTGFAFVRVEAAWSRGGLETRLVSALIVSEEVAYLGRSRRFGFFKTGEGGFEGVRLLHFGLDFS